MCWVKVWLLSKALNGIDLNHTERLSFMLNSPKPSSDQYIFGQYCLLNQGYYQLTATHHPDKIWNNEPEKEVKIEHLSHKQNFIRSNLILLMSLGGDVNGHTVSNISLI
jgi:hypothetical protein